MEWIYVPVNGRMVGISTSKYDNNSDTLNRLNLLFQVDGDHVNSTDEKIDTLTRVLVNQEKYKCIYKTE